MFTRHFIIENQNLGRIATGGGGSSTTYGKKIVLNDRTGGVVVLVVVVVVPSRRSGVDLEKQLLNGRVFVQERFRSRGRYLVVRALDHHVAILTDYLFDCDRGTTHPVAS